MDWPSSPDSETRVRLSGTSDPRLTLGPLWLGPGDPKMRFEGRVVARASRTAAGPASVRLVLRRDDVEAQAWGPGAAAALGSLP
jgi:hypothetical protein